MARSKEECEKLIRETPLFSINKEEEPSRYHKEALKLVEYLYEYLISPRRTSGKRKPWQEAEERFEETVKEVKAAAEEVEQGAELLEDQSKYAPYGEEIVNVAKRCIENYKPEAGVFLHYFVTAWSMEYKHIQGRERVKESFRGMHLAEEQIRKYSRYARAAGSVAEDPGTEKFEEKISESMGISREEVKKLALMEKIRPQSGIAYNADGEELDLFDVVDSGTYVDQRLFEEDAAKQTLFRIQAVFDALQERQKPLIGKLLTAKLSLPVAENVQMAKLLKEMSYFDKEIFVQCIRTGGEVEAKEISALMGLTEASVSRSWKNFRAKLLEAGIR